MNSTQKKTNSEKTKNEVVNNTVQEDKNTEHGDKPKKKRSLKSKFARIFGFNGKEKEGKEKEPDLKSLAKKAHEEFEEKQKMRKEIKELNNRLLELNYSPENTDEVQGSEKMVLQDQLNELKKKFNEKYPVDYDNIIADMKIIEIEKLKKIISDMESDMESDMKSDMESGISTNHDKKVALYNNYVNFASELSKELSDDSEEKVKIDNIRNLNEERMLLPFTEEDYEKYNKKTDEMNNILKSLKFDDSKTKILNEIQPNHHLRYFHRGGKKSRKVKKSKRKRTRKSKTKKRRSNRRK